MSNEKQTANEILAKQKEIASIIFDRNWHILNKNNDELLLSVIEEDMIIDSHIEYANQQTSEMEIKLSEQSTAIGVYQLDVEEMQNEIEELKSKVSDWELVTNHLRDKHTTLKQSADEMASHLEDAINITIDSTNYDKYMKIIENYKKLI